MSVIVTGRADGTLLSIWKSLILICSPNVACDTKAVQSNSIQVKVCQAGFTRKTMSMTTNSAPGAGCVSQIGKATQNPKCSRISICIWSSNLHDTNACHPQALASITNASACGAGSEPSDAPRADQLDHQLLLRIPYGQSSDIMVQEQVQEQVTMDMCLTDLHCEGIPLGETTRPRPFLAPL